MKKILFVSGLLFMGITTTFAQEQQMKAKENPQNRVEMRKTNRNQLSPEQRADLQTKRLDKTVKLTDEQRAKARSVYLKAAQENQGRVALRQATQKEIQTILTADQNQALEAANKERMAQMRERKTLRRSGLKAAPVEKTTPGAEIK